MFRTPECNSFATLVDYFQTNLQWLCTPRFLITSTKGKESHAKAAKSKSKSVGKCQNKGLPNNPYSVPLWHRKDLHWKANLIQYIIPNTPLVNSYQSLLKSHFVRGPVPPLLQVI